VEGSGAKVQKVNFLWILDRDAVAVLIPLISALWAIGGSGPKWVRRFMVPAVIAISAISLGVSWLLSISAGLFLALVASMGYGVRKHETLGRLYFPFLFGIGALNGASLFPLAIHSGAWGAFCGCVALCSVTFGALTLASQKLDFPKWKFVEMLTGASVGTTAFFLLS
jgi:hypothetical protein